MSYPAVEMEIRRRYPTMIPFVGRRFADSFGPRILLVGESHYLPKTSTQHLDPAAWYSGSAATLTNEEVRWISTAAIVRGACAEGFKNKAHWIWKNAFQAINDAGPKYEHFVDVAEDVAFCNFFQRPARTGQSLRPTPSDVAIANEVFDETIRSLEPGAVAFISRCAWRHFGAKRALSVPVIATSHPSSAHWNRVNRSYGNRSGKQVLQDFVQELGWCHSAAGS